MKQAIFLISLFCCLSLIAQPHSDQRSGHAADLFITPDSSLSETIRKAREMRRLGKATEVTIHLAPGTYALYEPLQLRPEDSGLTITGDKAIISGGLRISNWKKQGKLWVAAVPDFNGRPIDFRQLWITGEKATRARDVSDFEQMARICAYDKKNQVLWVPKKAVEKILKAPYAEMVLHEMWCTSNLRIKSITPQGDSAAIRSQSGRPHPIPASLAVTNDSRYQTPVTVLSDQCQGVVGRARRVVS